MTYNFPNLHTLFLNQIEKWIKFSHFVSCNVYTYRDSGGGHFKLIYFIYYIHKRVYYIDIFIKV